MKRLPSDSFKSADSVKCALAEESLRSTGKLRMRAMGWSMAPTLWPGDILEIEAVSGDLVAAGDIALFRREGRLFAHRVIAKAGTWGGEFVLVTQGDGMAEADPAIFSAQLLGKVCLVSRGVRPFRPSARVSVTKRAAFAVVRRSALAFRILARLHSMRRISQEQIAACRQ